MHLFWIRLKIVFYFLKLFSCFFTVYISVYFKPMNISQKYQPPFSVILLIHIIPAGHTPAGYCFRGMIVYPKRLIKSSSKITFTPSSFAFLFLPDVLFTSLLIRYVVLADTDPLTLPPFCSITDTNASRLA